MTKAEIEAIRERLKGSFWMCHPVVNPCYCGICNPTAHSDHPMFPELMRVRTDIEALLAEVGWLRGMAMKGLMCPECGYLFETVAKLDAHACGAAPDDPNVYSGSTLESGDLLRRVSERIRMSSGEVAFDAVGMSADLWRSLMADLGVRTDPLAFASSALHGVYVKTEEIPSDRVRLYLKGELVGELVGFEG